MCHYPPPQTHESKFMSHVQEQFNLQGSRHICAGTHGIPMVPNLWLGDLLFAWEAGVSVKMGNMLNTLPPNIVAVLCHSQPVLDKCSKLTRMVVVFGPIEPQQLPVEACILVFCPWCSLPTPYRIQTWVCQKKIPNHYRLCLVHGRTCFACAAVKRSRTEQTCTRIHVSSCNSNVHPHDPLLPLLRLGCSC